MHRLALIPLALLALAGCGGSSDAGCTADNAVGTSTVNLTMHLFEPACLRVSMGTTVTFRNQDTVPHTVTTDAGQPETFDSGLFVAGAEYQHTFAVAGTLHVHCEVHPGMKATIFVVP